MPTLEEGEDPELRGAGIDSSGFHADDRRHRAADGGSPPAVVRDGHQNWIELVLTVPIVLWAGWPFFVRAVQSVANRSPNMWTLIGLGTAAAFVYSVVATVAPGVFPASFVSMGRVSGLLRGSRCDHLAHAAPAKSWNSRRARRPRLPSSRCLAWRPRRLAESTPMALKRMCRSRTSTWATVCACGLEKKCRWTAWCSKAAARSMNPC